MSTITDTARLGDKVAGKYALDCIIGRGAMGTARHQAAVRADADTVDDDAAREGRRRQQRKEARTRRRQARAAAAATAGEKAE